MLESSPVNETNHPKVLDMAIQNPMNESDIANAAALILQKCFIEAARNGTVLYVENDALMSKNPNSEPVLIKKLSGRDPDLAKKFASRGTYELKKLNISGTNK